jgi:hypothetical protein
MKVGRHNPSQVSHSQTNNADSTSTFAKVSLTAIKSFCCIAMFAEVCSYVYDSSVVQNTPECQRYRDNARNTDRVGILARDFCLLPELEAAKRATFSNQTHACAQFGKFVNHRRRQEAQKPPQCHSPRGFPRFTGSGWKTHR